MSRMTGMKVPECRSPPYPRHVTAPLRGSVELLADLHQSVTDPPAFKRKARVMARSSPKELIHLGKPSTIPASPAEAVLDRVPNLHPDTDYVARFAFPEFTCICPVTGQPDFAIMMIDYVPRRWVIESKSLKLYLNSFRNHGAFHEESTVAIGKRVVKLLAPKWLRIAGYL